MGNARCVMSPMFMVPDNWTALFGDRAGLMHSHSYHQRLKVHGTPPDQVEVSSQVQQSVLVFFKIWFRLQLAALLTFYFSSQLNKQVESMKAASVMFVIKVHFNISRCRLRRLLMLV